MNLVINNLKGFNAFQRNVVLPPSVIEIPSLSYTYIYFHFIDNNGTVYFHTSISGTMNYYSWTADNVLTLIMSISSSDYLTPYTKSNVLYNLGGIDTAFNPSRLAYYSKELDCIVYFYNQFYCKLFDKNTLELISTSSVSVNSYDIQRINYRGTNINGMSKDSGNTMIISGYGTVPIYQLLPLTWTNGKLPYDPATVTLTDDSNYDLINVGGQYRAYKTTNINADYTSATDYSASNYLNDTIAKLNFTTLDADQYISIWNQPFYNNRILIKSINIPSAYTISFKYAYQMNSHTGSLELIKVPSEGLLTRHIGDYYYILMNAYKTGIGQKYLFMRVHNTTNFA